MLCSNSSFVSHQLHVSVVRPSSSGCTQITEDPSLTTDPLSLGDGAFIRSTQRYYCRFFYYLILLKLLHVSVVRPSSGRNIFARIYSTDNVSVVFRI
jgi:hypothetical protein